MAITAYDVTCEKNKLNKYESKSPYLTGDRVQLLSRITEKRFVHKKTLDYVSSFPLAVNIYKANSDEFKSLKRANKKIKKSVLTLPNEPSPAPQICTVSDMNDSEYCSHINDHPKAKIKKRTDKNIRKVRAKNKDYEFYDRDARCCSQVNINLDCSSNDLLKNYNGGGRKNANISRQNPSISKAQSNTNENNLKPHDVWMVLRNMNRQKFHRPSPPMSDESVITPIKKKNPKKRIKSKDTRFIETCRTEEFAYISSYDVNDFSHSVSQSSSFDRVTVINKDDEFNNICKQFEDTFLKKNSIKPSTVNNNQTNKIKIPKKKVKRNNMKALCYTKPKGNNNEIPPSKYTELVLESENTKENDWNKYGDDDKNKKSSIINLDNAQSIECSEPTSVCSICSNLNKNVVDRKLSLINNKLTRRSNLGFTSPPEVILDQVQKEKGFSGRKLLEKIPHERFSRLKGITGSISPPLRHSEVQPRKSCFVTTMPSACMMPKLTQTEIKRRLASMKFPLVILGREQVSSIVEMQNYDPPQFNGLDKQIWPFMVKWQENEINNNDIGSKHVIQMTDRNGKSVKRCDNFPIANLNKTKKNFQELTANKQFNHMTKKYVNRYLNMPKNRTDLKKSAASSYTNNNIEQNKKHTSITQLKDKMLNLLYKKVSERHIDDTYCSPIDTEKWPKLGSVSNKVDACVETRMSSPVSSKSPVRSETRRPNRVRSPNKKIPNDLRYPWAKAKWASDFIENVIKKIKSGAYYSQDHKYIVNHVTETSMQTDIFCDQEDIICENMFTPKVTNINKEDIPETIPGFNSSLPGLEIKTLNINQIAVKHCVTNVMMQFDVTVPAHRKQIVTSPKPSSCLIPVQITESHTKIFKCQTTILNAMLPAELCSILPKMMSIIHQNFNAAIPLHSCIQTVKNTDSHLSMIREVSHNEMTTTATINIDSLGSFISSPCPLKPAGKVLLGGMFSNILSSPRIPVAIKDTSIIMYDILFRTLLPKLSVSVMDIPSRRIRSFLPVSKSNVEYSNIEIPNPTEKLRKQGTTCTAVELYTSKNKRLIPPFAPYNLMTTIINIFMKNQLLQPNLNYMINIFVHTNPYDNQTRNMKLLNLESSNNTVHLTMTDNLQKINLKVVKRGFPLPDSSSVKYIEYIKHFSNNGCKNIDETSVSEFKRFSITKYKRRAFHKLYKKCKSTSNIPSGEKDVNFPLNKIENMDDFFEIFGSRRMLASIFEGYFARKILSAVIEMRTWIPDISPRQAMLILLLTNKKDTPNLVRFRPILLQGIAVNRITRATELDMEIEVIERENLNKLSQYDGISYLPASIENHDQLLEELFWIAKTTASDYQRPFDESSERLLKSLLEKRKKLNPSYLRVMARYVGLGLLKTPTTKK